MPGRESSGKSLRGNGVRRNEYYKRSYQAVGMRCQWREHPWEDVGVQESESGEVTVERAAQRGVHSRPRGNMEQVV
jgi:hypothetical protein